MEHGLLLIIDVVDGSVTELELDSEWASPRGVPSWSPTSKAIVFSAATSSLNGSLSFRRVEQGNFISLHIVTRDGPLAHNIPESDRRKYAPHWSSGQ